MANKYQGFVEFTDSEGQRYVLRLSTFHYVEASQKWTDLSAREYQMRIFHLALHHGAKAQSAEAQEHISIEEAADVMDDIGYDQANELIERTKFGANIKRSAEIEKRRREEAEIAAAKTLAQKIATLRKGVTDPVVLQVIDDVIAKVDELTRPKEGSANPLEAAMTL